MRDHFLATIFCAAVAWAGPPFQTDDPEPIDYKNYAELYTFAAADGTHHRDGHRGPGGRVQLGRGFRNVHLHVVAPAGRHLPLEQWKYAPEGDWPSVAGLGDIEIGIKFRFIQETKHRPQVGTFSDV